MQSNDFEIAFLEGVLSRRPNYVDAMIPLAEAYTRKGFFEKGLKVDQRLVALRSNDPIVRYNLACSYALAGKTGLAFRAIKCAVSLGYDDFEHLDNDPDLLLLREYLPFCEWILKQKNLREQRRGIK